ncbi:MAG: outer membrane protein assembly factor BamC [Gammaproteobacteria bacterium]|nr:outer membrane protein assembly factor BamC [Gammaproteobacteria bacterium]
MNTRNLLILAGLTVLNSCNYLLGDEGLFPDPQDDYLEAQTAPQMEIPNQLDSYTLDQLYVIPERFSSLVALEEVPMPRPIETRRREGVRIQSLADARWIVIDATPGQVWPLVRDYWTELQIILDYEDPSRGIMETSWVEVGSDNEKRHKYQITIEPGLHSGYSEIYILHHENLSSEPVPIVVSWPEQSTSPDLERQIQTSISQYLADRNDVYQASSASLLAGSIEAESKANLIENSSGEAILELKVDYNRAWVQVRQALESAEITIIASDRDQSIFNVQFAGIMEEDDEPSLIGRWFGGNDEEIVEVKDFNVRLLPDNDVINVVTEAAEISDDSVQLTEELLQVINDNLS